MCVNYEFNPPSVFFKHSLVLIIEKTDQFTYEHSGAFSSKRIIFSQEVVEIKPELKGD